MAELEPDTPLAPPAETIHMPEPSYLPFFFAIGMTIALVGVITWFPIVVIGLLIVIPVLIRWIRSTREDMAELPLDHAHH